MFRYMQLGLNNPHVEIGDPGRRPTPQIRLSQLLGSGRHGMVFMGTQKIGERDRDVAVKIPCAPRSLDHERAALMRLRHRNIVALLDGPLANGALVLEHCDLGTLADHLCEHVLTVGELRWMFDALLPALDHIHRTGWIHGDISPGNIGLRMVEGPALLDFASARPADGSCIDEGTPEFAGPLRRADPALDIRCLAATAVTALGAADRWDHRKKLVQEELAALIQRCDAAELVGVDDLAVVLRDLPPRTPPGQARRRMSGGGSDQSTTTRAFGPRPAPEPIRRSEHPTRRRPWVLVLAGALMTGAIVAEFMTGGSARSGDAASSTEPATLMVERTAQETLAHAEATWDSSTGVITLETASGLATRLAAGKPGDLAAIGDWSCDGTETLGVYRPTSGNWFTFDSWEQDSLAVPTMLDRGDRLTVVSDGNGCATPIVR